MFAETSSRGRRVFPELCVQLRTGSRSSRIVLPPIVQMGAVAALTLVAVALSYFGVTRIGNERALAEKETAVVRAETANADLQDKVSRLQDRLALVTREREEAEAG